MIALLLAAIAPVRADDSSSASGISNASVSTYIVVFNDTPQHTVRAQSTTDYITSYGGRVKDRYSIINGMAVTMPDDAADRLKSLPNVKYVEKDQQVHILLNQAIPQIGANISWGEGYNGSGVRVAVIDTGVDVGHPDLDGSKVTGWIDYVNGRATPYDDNGHGTHISGILAGTGNASSGKYTGVAPGASLLEAKVLNSTGGGAGSSVINAIQWAVANKAQVISLSFGGQHDSALNTAIDNAVASGVTVVVAAGNDGPYSYSIACPGDDPNVITVGAVYKNDTLANFSARGPTLYGGYTKPDVVDVGVYVVAANASGIKNPLGYRVNGTNGYYQGMSGTSMATPMTAGVVALMLEKDPNLTPAEVKSILTRTAKPLDNTEPIPNNDWGWGRVQANYAVDNVTLYNSSYVSDTIPGTFLPNQTVAVTITMANTGPSNWTRTSNITLRGSYDASRFGATSFCLSANATIPKGQQYAWSFNLTAPATPGPYALSYRMYGDTDPFGDVLNKSVRVNTTIRPGTIRFNGSVYSASRYAGNAAIRVDRVDGLDNAIAVNYSTGGGNATPGVDYTPASGTLTFAQDQDHGFINVTLLGNGTCQDDKMLNLTLSDPTEGAALGFPGAAVLLVNDTPMISYDLVPGWNLISVPIDVPDHSLTGFFPPGVISGITDAWGWNDSVQDFEYYNPDSEDSYYEIYPILTKIETGRAYWVKMNRSASFTIQGSFPGDMPNRTVPVNGIWSFVGPTGLSASMPPAMYPNATCVWTWDSTAQDFEYYSPDPGDSYYEIYPKLTVIKPGQGYWVELK